MNFQEAKDITRQYIYSEKTIHVTSDGCVYLNANIDVIEKHAKENNLEVFHIKPEILETKKSKK